MMAMLVGVMFFGNGFFSAQAVVIFFYPVSLTYKELRKIFILSLNNCIYSENVNEYFQYEVFLRSAGDYFEK